jgi:hypothetical protein
VEKNDARKSRQDLNMKGTMKKDLALEMERHVSYCFTMTFNFNQKGRIMLLDMCIGGCTKLFFIFNF